MKRIAQIVVICLMIATIVVIATLGFKVGLKYSENTQIDINIGKQFNKEDIKAITDEVFPKESVMIQQVELYKDMLQITVKDVSEDQINNLNAKINEKYGIENKVSDVIVTKNSNTHLKDIVKPYIAPITISCAIIVVYAFIRFRKLGFLAVLYKEVLYIIAPQAILFAAYALCRLPINRVTTLLSLSAYIVSAYLLISKLIKENNSLKAEKSEETK